MEEKSTSKLICSVFYVLKLTLLGFFAIMIVACIETENSNYQKGATMRNEIIAYAKAFWKSGGKGPQVDVTHVVEKYIKMGDSYETAKEILLKNGFSVREYSVEEAAKRKNVRLTSRIVAETLIEGSWWDEKNIQIFLGDSPQSERVDSILAKVNYKTI